MVFREIIAVYSKNRTKQTKAPFGRNVWIFNAEEGSTCISHWTLKPSARN